MGEAPDPREYDGCAMCEDDTAPLDADGLCESCREKTDTDHAQIEALEAAGHTSHCAARQTWGDGECECQEERGQEERDRDQE